jgi:hypothetical protein
MAGPPPPPVPEDKRDVMREVALTYRRVGRAAKAARRQRVAILGQHLARRRLVERGVFFVGEIEDGHREQDNTGHNARLVSLNVLARLLVESEI